jgi:hypothetical protein
MQAISGTKLLFSLGESAVDICLRQAGYGCNHIRSLSHRDKAEIPLFAICERLHRAGCTGSIIQDRHGELSLIFRGGFNRFVTEARCTPTRANKVHTRNVAAV